MKKLSLILVLLLAVGLAAFAGEPSVSGTLSSQINFDESGTTGNMGRIRMNVDVPVGDFVTVKMDIRDDTIANNYFSFNQVYATTDLSGIFGISDMVGLTLTMGKFEYWITTWQSAVSTNRARVTERFAVGNNDSVADVALDITVGSFGTVKAFLGGYPVATDTLSNTFAQDDLSYKFGFVLGDVVPGLQASVAYSGGKKQLDLDPDPDDTLYDGTTYKISYMVVDAGYTYDFGDGMSIYVPVGFNYELEAEEMNLGFGAKFTGFGLSAGVMAKMTDTKAGDMFFSVLDFQLAYAILDTGISVYFNGFGDPSDVADGGADDDFLQALDFGLKYDMAGNMMYVGYLADIGDTDKQTFPLMMDDSSGRHGIVDGGFYIASYINF